MNRTERLSFFTDGKITSLSQIRDKVVNNITAQPTTLTITYNDNTTLVIDRGGNDQTSVHIKSIAVVGTNKQLVVTDSNNVQYALGDLSPDIAYDTLPTSGIYCGSSATAPIFKPVIFTPAFIQTAEKYSIADLMRGSGLLSSRRLSVRNANDERDRSSSAGVWLTRRLDWIIENTIPNAALVAGSGVRLPQGKYFAKWGVHCLRMNSFTSRLTGTLTGVVLTSGSQYNVSSSIRESMPAIGLGFFDVVEPDDTFYLQTVGQTTTSMLTYTYSNLEVWKIE